MKRDKNDFWSLFFCLKMRIKGWKYFNGLFYWKAISNNTIEVETKVLPKGVLKIEILGKYLEEHRFDNILGRLDNVRITLIDGSEKYFHTVWESYADKKCFYEFYLSDFYSNYTQLSDITINLSKKIYRVMKKNAKVLNTKSFLPLKEKELNEKCSRLKRNKFICVDNFCLSNRIYSPIYNMILTKTLKNTQSIVLIFTDDMVLFNNEFVILSNVETAFNLAKIIIQRS